MGVCKGFLPEFPHTCPKRFCATLPLNFLQQRSRSFLSVTNGVRCDKKGLGVFFCKCCAPFFISQTRWDATLVRIVRDFTQIFRILPRFLGFCPDFQRLCPGFRKIKAFVGRFHPLHPRLLHHWSNPPTSSWTGLHGLTVLQDETIEWLLNTFPETRCTL